jgi:ferredoxin-thioredoxin reductase catalytic subunit
VSREKTPENALAFARAVADHQGWKLNPDDPFVRDVAEGLASNYNAYGYYLCPCRDGDGERQADRDIICPCEYAVPDQQEYGHCFCGLFVSEAFLASGREPQPIPERRPDQD